MALSRPSQPSAEEERPLFTTLSLSSLTPEQESMVAQSTENKEELIQLRADMVCVGCRCGWLCCDCDVGCLACKQRRRFCYCRWVLAAATQQVVRVQCEICDALLQSCQCEQNYRCKWCTVSLRNCRRGGCLMLLPNRFSPDALPFVEIFNTQEKSEDEEEDERESLNEEEELETAATCSLDSGSSLDSQSFSSFSAASSTWTLGSTSSGAPEDMWDRPSSSLSDNGSLRIGRLRSKLSWSTSTLNSDSTGGSYDSIGGKSTF